MSSQFATTSAENMKSQIATLNEEDELSRSQIAEQDVRFGIHISQIENCYTP
jgi:hypothetical protein